MACSAWITPRWCRNTIRPKAAPSCAWRRWTGKFGGWASGTSAGWAGRGGARRADHGPRRPGPALPLARCRARPRAGRPAPRAAAPGRGDRLRAGPRRGRDHPEGLTLLPGGDGDELLVVHDSPAPSRQPDPGTLLADVVRLEAPAPGPPPGAGDAPRSAGGAGAARPAVNRPPDIGGRLPLPGSVPLQSVHQPGAPVRTAVDRSWPDPPAAAAGAAAHPLRAALTAVVAAAGFGKTTLLGQAVQENALSPLGEDHWLTCQPDDAALSFLASGTLAALGPRARPRGPAGGRRRRGGGHVEHRPPARRAGAGRRAPGRAGLARRPFLAALVEELPRNGHLVLASRPPLRLPTSRLVATGTRSCWASRTCSSGTKR